MNLRPQLYKDCEVKIRGIADKVIAIKQKVILPVTLGKQKYDVEFYINEASISPYYEGILGIIFLKKFDFMLDFKKQVLVNQSTTIQWNGCTPESSIVKCIPNVHTLPNSTNTAYGYAVSKHIIQPFSEKHVAVKVRDNRQSIKTQNVLVLPIGDDPFAKNFSVARAVGKLDTNDTMLIKVANFTLAPIHINKCSKIVEIQPLNTMEDFPQIANLQLQIDAELDPANTFDPSKEKFNLTHLDVNVRKELLSLLEDYKDVFASNLEDLKVGCTSVKQRVLLTDNIPVRRKPYRVPFALKAEMKRQIDEMLKANIIKVSNSPYASSVIMVKKADGTHRMCCDMRFINKKIVPDNFPIPSIAQLIDNLRGAHYFTTVDLTASFQQIPIDERDTYKLGFVTEDNQYEYLRLPFGANISGNAFQRIISGILAGVVNDNSLSVYIDDIIVATKTIPEHMQILRKLFTRLREHNLKLKISKCTFITESIKYLGFQVSKGMVQPDRKNVEAIKHCKIPTCRKNVRSYLGLTGFYRKFIKDYAVKARPLYHLTKDTTPFKWTPDAQQAFNTLKQDLISLPSLALPDLNSQFYLHTDASKYSIGCVLSQMDESANRLRPIAFGSRKLRPPECNYSAVELELLAVVYFVSYFKQYLIQNKFTVFSDQASLSHVMKLKDPTSRIARWLMTLQQYQFELKYTPAAQNQTADYMSRYIRPNETQPNPSPRDGNTETRPNTGIFNIQSEEPSKVFLERIKLHQGTDEKCCKLKLMLRSNEVIKPESLTFFEENDILYCRENDPDINRHTSRRVVVPFALIPEVFELAHSGHWSGTHGGISKTIQRVKTNFYWPKMVAHLRNLVKTCSQCILRRGHKHRYLPPLQRVPLADFPLHKIAVDFQGPLKKSSAGHKYILLICDYFTRVVEAYPCRDMQSNTIMSCFEKFFSHYGLPKFIVSDNQTSFCSKQINEFYRKLGITKLSTSAQNPSANGLVERFNAVLANSLSHLVNTQHDDWHNHLHLATYCHKTQIHQSTGYTPSYLMFGREFSNPADLLTNNDPQPHNEYGSYIQDFQQRLKVAKDISQKNLEKAAEIQENYRKSKYKSQNFEVGNEVYLSYKDTPQHLCKKWAFKNKGPFRITRQLNNVNFEITPVNTDSKLKVQVVHAKRLILSEPRLFPQPQQDSEPLPQSTPSEGTQTWRYQPPVQRRSMFRRYPFNVSQAQSREGPEPPFTQDNEQNVVENDSPHTSQSNVPDSTNQAQHSQAQNPSTAHTYRLRGNRPPPGFYME